VHRATLLAQRRRRTAPKPTSLNFAEAAALPLTAITAWELLFDRISLKRGEDRRSLLAIGGAGGLARSRSGWHASSRA
jgi:NADPH:quinone reductase-like Zn-dependent oxidoreductase